MSITLDGQQLLALLLSSVRVAAWLVVAPPFAGRSVPPMAKVVLSLGLALAISPGQAGNLPTNGVELVLVALTQVLIGAAMGFVTFLMLHAVTVAGSLVDMFGGFSATQAWDPMAMNTSTVFGRFYQMLATVLLFVSGGHLLVIGGLLSTFRVLPLGDFPEVAGTADVFVRAMSLFFITAVQIALPLIAVLFVTDLALALLTKVAPQLNALNVMFAAKIGLTLLLIGLSFPVLPEAIDRLVDLANEAMSALAGGS